MNRNRIGMLAGLAAAAAALVSVPAAQSAAGFSANVTNPWYPLKPGTTYTYTGTKDGQPSRDVLKVTRRTKRINGVPCRVLDDRLYVRGRLAERTTDWYTQDAKGNVWYYGEATAELDAQGRVTSTEGSWRAGVDGARAGIYMPAQPKVGQSLRQEYYKGHAEDRFRVLGLHTKVKVPYVSSTNALLTEETTALEPGVVDHKVYVRGIGTVKEQTVRGGSETAVLVSKTS